MYRDFEKEYKKKYYNRNFDFYYLKWSIILLIIFAVIDKYFAKTELVIPFFYLSLILICFNYYFQKYIKFLKTNRNEKKFFSNVKSFINNIENEKNQNFLLLLKENKFNSKTNLKVVIDYYNRKKPILLETSFFGWIITFSLTLASFVEIAYDDKKGLIDYEKLNVIFSSTVFIIILFIISMFFIKFLFSNFKISKNKIYSNIEENLTKVYLNFDKYKNRL